MSTQALSIDEIFKIVENLPKDATQRVRIHFKIMYPNYKCIWTTAELFYDDEEWMILPSEEYVAGGKIWGFRNDLFYFSFSKTGENLHLYIYEITRDEKLKQMLYSLKTDLEIDMSNKGQHPDVRNFKCGEVVLEIYELFATARPSVQETKII